MLSSMVKEHQAKQQVKKELQGMSTISFNNVNSLKIFKKQNGKKLVPQPVI